MRHALVLLAIGAASLPFLVQAQAPAAGVEAGRALAMDRSKGNCLACHTMQGSDVPSNVGPELTGLKERFPDRSELVAIVTNEPARNPQTIMPPFGRNHILSAPEIEQVVDFLYTL